MRAPPARSGGAAGVSHDSPRAQTCTFERPVFKTPPKFNEKTPREEEKNEFFGGRGKKRAKFWAVQGKGCPAEGGPGKGGPGEGRSRGRAVQGKGGPGEGRFRGRVVPGRAVPGRAVLGAPNMTKPKP